jgi:Uma2 family endonuclease
MIAAKENPPQLTPEEYFVWEAKQPEKHEYINGQVYAMSGGSVNHGRIAIRLTAMFDTHVENSGCITGNSDIKINIVATITTLIPMPV